MKIFTTIVQAVVIFSGLIYAIDNENTLWLNPKYISVLDATGSLNVASQSILESDEPVAILGNLNTGKFKASYNFHETVEFRLPKSVAGIIHLDDINIGDSINVSSRAITVYKGKTKAQFSKFSHGTSFESSISIYFKNKFLQKIYHCNDEIKLTILDSSLIFETNSKIDSMNYEFQVDYVEFSPLDNIIIKKNNKAISYGIIRRELILQMYELDDEQHYIKKLKYQCDSDEIKR